MARERVKIDKTSRVILIIDEVCRQWYSGLRSGVGNWVCQELIRRIEDIRPLPISVVFETFIREMDDLCVESGQDGAFGLVDFYIECSAVANHVYDIVNSEVVL